MAKHTETFPVVGVVGKVGAKLFCGVMLVCPRGEVAGKRREVMPEGSHLSLVNASAGRAQCRLDGGRIVQAQKE